MSKKSYPKICHQAAPVVNERSPDYSFWFSSDIDHWIRNRSRRFNLARQQSNLKLNTHNS